MPSKISVSVVLPCLNEAGTIGDCVCQAKKAFKELRLTGEVVVADNGSVDQSVKLAKKAGARVVREKERGYGRACLKGLKSAKGELLILGDGDGTYQFNEIGLLIKPLAKGFDFACGNRLKGKMERGSLSNLHRHLGVPILTFILNLCFPTPIKDSHCGLRGLKQTAFRQLNLSQPGMEFASEMIIEAAKQKLKMTEVPVSYHARQSGVSKLRSWPDGWRHLKLILTKKING